jgi:hypothetical protein
VFGFIFFSFKKSRIGYTVFSKTGFRLLTK